MIDRRRSVDLGFALGLLSALSLVAAAYMIFFYAPTDSVQGDVQRIFYVHLGAVAGAYASFALVLLAGGFYLIADTRAPGSRFFNPGRALIADRLARTGAQVGLVFTTLVLVVGSLWAKPIWGTYWTWDPRLTATLVLWLTYGAYLMVRRMAISPRQAARLSAVVGVLGFFDVPIVHFSVTWWRTQHPPLVAGTASAMVPEMWWTLLVTMLALTLLTATFSVLTYRLEELRDGLAS